MTMQSSFTEISIGQQQAGRVWYKYLTKKLLMDLGFTNSDIDECVFYRISVMFILYTDESIIAGPNQQDLDAVVEDTKKENMVVIVEGTLEEFLGVNTKRRKDGSIYLTQPHLIEHTVNDLGQENCNTPYKSTTAQLSKILHSHKKSKNFDKILHYISVVGKLN